MSIKLRIDISQGLVDVEGEPEFVREVYADFKARFLNGHSSDGTQHHEQTTLDVAVGTHHVGEGTGLGADVPAWTNGSIHPVSVNFTRHFSRRSSLKRYLHF